MKTILRLSIFLLLILLINSCFPVKKIAGSDNSILPYSDTVAIRDGSIVYGLPRTVFTVYVNMERTIEKPGPFYKYAGDLLGIDDIIKEENESWSIQGITVKTHAELDPSELYIINSNNLFRSNALILRKEGLILDLNPEDLDDSENKILGTKSGISPFHTFDMGSDEYYLSQRDTAYRRLAVDSSFIRIPYVVEKKKRLTVDQLAERAAKRLMELRDGKHLILTGEATVFPQNEAAIDEINRMEKEYTELFTGKTFTESLAFSYQIIPDKKMSGKPVTVLQFSELTGPVDPALKGGVPVVLELNPEQKTKSLTVINAKRTETEENKYDKLFYRVPDVVNLKISTGSEVLYNSRKLIYQFGEVIQLPENYIIGK